MTLQLTEEKENACSESFCVYRMRNGITEEKKKC